MSYIRNFYLFLYISTINCCTPKYTFFLSLTYAKEIIPPQTSHLFSSNTYFALQQSRQKIDFNILFYLTLMFLVGVLIAPIRCVIVYHTKKTYPLLPQRCSTGYICYFLFSAVFVFIRHATKSLRI